jgi:hypothetical protein
MEIKKTKSRLHGMLVIEKLGIDSPNLYIKRKIKGCKSKQKSGKYLKTRLLC